MKRTLAAVAILTLTSSSAFAFGLSSLSGSGSSPAGLSADQIQAQFGSLSKEYNLATKSFMLSASTALAAFDAKTSSERLKSEADQLGTGTVSSDDVERHTALLKSAKSEVTAKLKSGEKLSEAGKAKFVQSMVHLGKGVATEGPLVATVASLSKSTADSMKSISFTQIGKVKATASALTTLSSSLPQDMGLAKDTMGLYVDYAKTNRIDVPKDVTDLFK